MSEDYPEQTWDDPVVGYIVTKTEMRDGDQTVNAFAVIQGEHRAVVAPENDSSEWHELGENTEIVDTFAAPEGIFRRDRAEVGAGEVEFDKFISNLAVDEEGEEGDG